MDEDITKEMNGARPLLERILSRLDSIDARLDSMDARLSALEQQAERAAMSTKPIWEQALAEILEIKESVRVVESKLDVMNKELLAVKAEQNRFNTRLEDVERRPS